MAETDGIVMRAIVATAGITIIIAGICFYFFYRYAMACQRQKNSFLSSFRRETVRDPYELRQSCSTVKGLVVDEDGLEVLYLRRLEGGQLRSCVSTVWFNPMEQEEEEEKRVHNIPSTQRFHHPKVVKPASLDQKPITPPLLHPQVPPFVIPVNSPPPPPPPPPPQVPSTNPTKITPKPPLPPPPPPPPPALSSAPTKAAAKPPPPASPMPGKGNPAPPPPPFRSGGLASSLKPPRGKLSSGSREDVHTDERSKGYRDAQMKMRPFHWDKVNMNADHSLVWNEIKDGSLRFDDELMEALFGYNATNRKSPEVKNISSGSNSAPPAQILILDPRKSQNTAIVLKSLAISRKEILDALLEGNGLNGDTLEKLTKISPTEEETSKILQFTGNPTRLADGESFLYHILKAIPSAFIRINAMLFRSNYDPEILHLKESLQTLEFGCKELRTRGIFLKLLEAILKAGNRMNAGTARGNAQGFNLSALRKLSYVKSTDGKTTLLHFVVEQVLRSEGKRNKNHRIDQDSDSLEAKEERDKECIMFGLPVLGALNTEFRNVKKAAIIDYENFISMSPNLTTKITEIRHLVTLCGNSEKGGFVKEMKGFLEECEDELKVVREEQTRVMELVKRTTDFYQAGGSKDKGTSPFQIFGFVKDFLDMVDQVCIDITQKIQKKKVKSVVGSSPPLSPTTRNSLMYQNLQSYFRQEKAESDDDF